MNLKAVILAGALLAAPASFAADAQLAAAPAAPAGTVQSAAPQQSEGAAPVKKANPWTDMLPMIIIIVVMIFLFSRSGKKQQQKRQQMLDRIVKGARVMLNSGVYGTVSEVREKDFIVEIAENVRIQVIKNGIASVEEELDAKKDAK